MRLTFDDFGLPFPGDVQVGSFSGRFSLDDDGLIEWIELDGYRPADRSWEAETVTVYPGDQLYDLLADPLLKAFADEIEAREAANRPYVDPYAEHRLSAAQMGVGR